MKRVSRMRVKGDDYHYFASGAFSLTVGKFTNSTRFIVWFDHPSFSNSLRGDGDTLHEAFEELRGCIEDHVSDMLDQLGQLKRLRNVEGLITHRSVSLSREGCSD